MNKSYFFGILFLCCTFYGFSQTCTGFTLSSDVASVCSGDSAIITLSDSEAGYNYEIRIGTTVINTIPGNDNSISFTVNPTTTTTYNVIAIATF